MSSITHASQAASLPLKHSSHSSSRRTRSLNALQARLQRSSADAAPTADDVTAIGPQQRRCDSCRLAAALYTCPRCNASTCSLKCYQTHAASSAPCQRAIDENRTPLRSNASVQMSMNEILQRQYKEMRVKEEEEAWQEQQQSGAEAASATMRSQPSDGKEPHDPDQNDKHIAELVQAARDGTITLDELTPSQRADFEQALADGRWLQWMPPNEPSWWTPEASLSNLSLQDAADASTAQSFDESWLPQLVLRYEFVSDGESSAAVENRADQQWASKLPQVSTLLPATATVSPLLPDLLVQTFYAYVFVYRLYQGEWIDNNSDQLTMPASSSLEEQSYLSLEAAKDVISIAPSITARASKDASFSFLTLIGDSLSEITSNANLQQGPLFSLLALRDTAHFCLNPHLSLRALYDLHQLFQRMKMIPAARKMYFYACFVQGSLHEASVKSHWSEIGQALSLMYQTQRAQLNLSSKDL